MKISIIGTGAVGGFYGSLLATSGNEVHFLMRSDYEFCKINGLRLTSPLGDLHILPAEDVLDPKKHYAYFHKDPGDLPQDSDFVIVSIKATENENLATLLNNFKETSPSILLIQNGLGQENHIHIQLPNANRIFGGLAFLCSVKDSPGHIHHIDYGDLTIAESIVGDMAAELDQEIEKLGKAFRNARISVTLESDLTLARWQKLVWNIPFNGLSVLLDATTEEIVSHPNSLALVRDIMKEVQLAAGCDERIISDAFIEERIQRTFHMKPYKTSMKVDYDHKKPMELEAIYLDPIMRAELHDRKLPRIQSLYQELSFLESRNLLQKNTTA
jgi:2-dehydropantoate 2-reductase